MSRLPTRRRLCAVGLSLALAVPVLSAPVLGGTATANTASNRTFAEIRLRDSGPRVLLAQRVLDVEPRTGVYNQKTKRHVKHFQDHRHFAVTGVINQRTYNALETRWDAIHAARVRIDRKYHRVMKIARNQKGDPYVFGAAGPRAFDCSGLVLFVYQRAAGISLTHLASAQFRRADRIKKRNARPGDLVFFHGGGGVYHVGIYAGSGDVIHAPHSGSRVHRSPIWTRQVSYGRLLPHK
jgi:cell wall-associated NlpC family hydrolase